MRIVPVIDLKDGAVVHGIAGKRHQYQPVESVLGCDATPSSIAEAYRRCLGFEDVYVADLDAIAGAEPNWRAYDEIAGAGLELAIDAGISNEEHASRLTISSGNHRSIRGIVIGLESLVSETSLANICSSIGPERAIFSLDLGNGKPLTKLPNWSTFRPIDLVDEVVTSGFKRMIILDLASVGVGEGLSVLELCASVTAKYPQLEITSGGGVRHVSDLDDLASAGCAAALVASALHNGNLSNKELMKFR